MEQATSLRFMPADEYLNWEPAQAEKYEFIHGEIFLQGGASRRHVTVAGNLFAELDRRLENTNCRAYMADMKLQVKEFVLIDPERMHIELYRRSQENIWELRDIPAEQPLHFSCLDMTIPWSRIFRNVD